VSEISRRKLLALGVTVVAAAGCGKVAYKIQGDDLPAHIDLPKGDVQPTIRLLNRAGFGPKPGQVAAIEKIGHEAYIEDQLRPTEEEPLALSMQLGNLESPIDR